VVLFAALAEFECKLSAFLTRFELFFVPAYLLKVTL
jgi:hypothetical protein